VHNSIKLLVQNNYRQRLAKKQPPKPVQPQYTGYNNPTYNKPTPQMKNYSNASATTSSAYGQRQNSWNQQNKWNNQSSWNSQSNWSQSRNQWGSSQSNGYNRNNNNYGQTSSYNEPLNVPKPSYTPFRSVSNANNTTINANINSSNQSANAQKAYGQSIRRGPEFDEDVICWAFNSFLGCPNGANCQWVHECYDTSKDSGFDICWAFNSKSGCRYGNECEWRHDRHPNKWRTIRKSR